MKYSKDSCWLNYVVQRYHQNIQDALALQQGWVYNDYFVWLFCGYISVKTNDKNIYVEEMLIRIKPTACLTILGLYFL